MDRDGWQERYGRPDRVWSGKPSPRLPQVAEGRAPGRALDLACGEGADAVWLAEHGWQVTAVDFASNALARGQEAASAAGVAERIEWVEADLTEWQPPDTYDLVAIHFLHGPPELWQAGIAAGAGAVAPGGMLLVVAHDPSQLTEGNGMGPPDPSVLYGPSDIVAALPAGLIVEVAEVQTRETETGPWRDAVVIASAE